MAEYYKLRMFDRESEVDTSTVAIVPGGQSFPNVGQTIGDKWRVTGVLKRPEVVQGSGLEYHVCLEELLGQGRH
jgi:hypothetical protein